MTVLSRQPAAVRVLLVLLGVGLGLNLRDIAAAIGTPIPALPIPYGGSLLDNALAVLMAVLLALLLRPAAWACWPASGCAETAGADRCGCCWPA